MSPEALVGLCGVIIVVITLIVLIIRRLPKRVSSSYYLGKWREIQTMCSRKEDWAHAIIHADMLLDEIFVRKKVTGKSMGERMVTVQNKLSAHDSVWDAHKLANTLRQNAELKLSETKVKETLVAFRQALRDMGALK